MDDNHGFFSRFFSLFVPFSLAGFCLFVYLFICWAHFEYDIQLFSYCVCLATFHCFGTSDALHIHLFSVCLPSSWLLLLLAAAAAVACSLASFFHCLRSLFSNFVSLRVVVFSSIVFSPTIYLSLKLRTLNVYLLPVSVSLFFRLFIFLSVDCERGS